MNRSDLPGNDPDARRQRARRTALWMAAVAVAVYLGFIALGAFGQ